MYKIKQILIRFKFSLLPAILALLLLSMPAYSAERFAVFAGGCFWCMEEAFEKLPGVTEAVSGYSGGKTDNPTYKKVTGGRTGHYEAIRVTYDDTKISYEQLLTAFWRNVDPLDDGGQFCDRGSSYKTAVFYMNSQELQLAQASKRDAERFLRQKTVTPLLRFDEFYDAEGYHQDYYKVNPVRYKYYKTGCGRAARLEKLWGKPKPTS